MLIVVLVLGAFDGCWLIRARGGCSPFLPVCFRPSSSGLPERGGLRARCAFTLRHSKEFCKCTIWYDSPLCALVSFFFLIFFLSFYFSQVPLRLPLDVRFYKVSFCTRVVKEIESWRSFDAWKINDFAFNFLSTLQSFVFTQLILRPSLLTFHNFFLCFIENKHFYKVMFFYRCLPSLLVSLLAK